MKRLTWLICCLLSALPIQDWWLKTTLAQSPTVAAIEPAAGATGVDTTANLKITFSESLDTATLGGVRLLAPGGYAVPAIVDTDATQGLLDLRPLVALDPNSIYTVDVTDAIHGASGSAATPFTTSFTTGPAPIGGVGSEFRYSATSLGDIPSVSSVAYGPDGHLYASDGVDSIWRYPLDPVSGLLAGAPERLYQQENMQTVGIAFSPNATTENLMLYTSHATRVTLSEYTGAVSRFDIPAYGEGSTAVRSDVIVGLPAPVALNHQPNGLTFGPDGKMYHVIGGMATLGGSPNWFSDEKPLSAAVLVADVEGDPTFSTTVDVNTSTGYDPNAVDAPVKIFATGLRNAYDLAWHSNGQLYSGINQNSLSGATTPDDPDQGGNQEVNFRPQEMLALVREGLYYGHPNPTRDEYILNGGNPTSGFDNDWEIPAYQPGVAPEPNFAGLPGTPAADGSPSGTGGLIYNTRASGGNSPNGLAEYTGPGALNGRLLVSYFSGARTIQTFELDPSTGLVTDTRPLENSNGQPLSLNGPLDVTVDPASGRVYVADFGLQSDFGQAGRLVMLDPLGLGVEGVTPQAAFGVTAHPMNPLNRAFDASASMDSDGVIDRYVWNFGDGVSATGPNPYHVYPRDGRYVAKLTVVDNDGLVNTASIPVEIGTALEALLVTASGPLSVGDRAVQKRLESLGYNVSLVTSGASNTADANGKDVVVISSSVPSGEVGNKFTSVTAGVVTWESFLFDNLLMTGDVQDTSYGFTTETYSDVSIVSQSPLAGGLTGDLLYSEDQQVFWGVPSASAEIIATLSDDPTKAALFAYDTGDPLVGGALAPGPRVGLFIFNETAARLTGDGWRLFDNAVLFASGLETPLPGDFNGDGSVDAADYTVWRDGHGVDYDDSHYALWYENYGVSALLTSTPAAAPEPGAWIGPGVWLAVSLVSFRGRRTGPEVADLPEGGRA